MESLKRARKARGMTLAQVAEGSGLLAQAVARAEREDTDPRASTVAAIAKALKAPVCEVYDPKVNHERHTKPRRAKA